MGMKKKVMAAGLAACMGATLIGGATLAYFTDKDERTNSFTVAGADGQPALDIVMTETSVEGNGMVAGVATDDGYKYENIVPGVTYSKNVDVDLGEKSIDSHLYVELTITNYENLCLATKGIETPGSGPVENIGKYIVNPPRQPERFQADRHQARGERYSRRGYPLPGVRHGRDG